MNRESRCIKSDNSNLSLASVAIHLSAYYARFQIAINLFNNVTIAKEKGLFIFNSKSQLRF